MDYKEPRRTVKNGPEAEGARRLRNYMERFGWRLWKIGGSKYASGWPDYYCFHKAHGHKWVETKSDTGKLTPSQIKRFGEMSRAGDLIYVAINELCYESVIMRPFDNWRFFV